MPGKPAKKAPQCSYSSQRRKKAFLKVFPEAFTISEACKRINIERSTFYDWLRDDPAFVVAFEHAKEESIEVLEQVARSRATGDKPSDLLMIFLMKGGNPEKYRDNARVEVGGKVQIEVIEVARKNSPENSPGAAT